MPLKLRTRLYAIKSYVEKIKDQVNWDRDLPEITRAINNSMHSSTNETPYKIVLGQYENIFDPNHINDDSSTRFLKIRKKVRENLKTAYEKSKKRYDLRMGLPIVYKPGQIVWLRNFKLSNAGHQYSTKLDDNYVKGVIDKRIGSNTYKIKDLNGKILGEFPSIHLKP